MKKLDLGQTITILANLGVIAGIVFLGLEISQNNRLLRSQSSYNHLENRALYRDAALGDPEFAEFFLRLRNDRATLSPSDILREQMLIERLLLNWQWEYGQLVDGNLSEGEFSVTGARQVFWGQGRTGPFIDVWETFKNTLYPNFVLWMEENVVEPGPP